MSFGVVIPSTYYDGVYYLETDGTDSSGNSRTIAGLNTPTFNVQRFGAGGMDGGTSGINRGLRSSIDICGGVQCTGYQVNMWFKLNSTSSLTTNSVFFHLQRDAGAGNQREAEVFALASISGANLVIQLVMSCTANAVATHTVVADLNWHYISFNAFPTVLEVDIVMDGQTSTGTGTGSIISPGADRFSIGNHATSSTLQFWGGFDMVTVGHSTGAGGTILSFQSVSKHYAQARGMFVV